MDLELNRFLEEKTEMLGNLTITDSIDVGTLTNICEEYHQAKLKLLGIGVVSNNEVALKAFLQKFINDCEMGDAHEPLHLEEARSLL
jgi:hypothetical protein